MPNSTPSIKQELISKALHEPLSFTGLDFDTLVSLQGDNLLTFDDIRLMMEAIYSINSTILNENSTEAFTGPLGYLNNKAVAKRLKIFNERVKTLPFDKRVNILAEGDSWFELPVGVHEIVGWLLKENPEYAIYSMANGGDWITNIIYDGKYVAELPIVDPHYFLISGGGNDLVGDNRVAIMVSKNANIPGREGRVAPQHLPASDHVTKDFFAFLITIKLQYFMMFRNIHTAFKHTIIITQGYDYAIPSYAWRFSLRYPLQYFVNWVADTGGWLKRPLDIKKIPSNLHTALVRFFIDEINEMYISLAQRPEFPNLFHIDCRGTAQSHDDWFDELHLKPYKFRIVANAFQKFMKGTLDGNLLQQVKQNKTFKVIDVK
jgi:hypothetical protein